MSSADLMSLLSGQMLLTLSIAVPLAFAASLLLLWIYRRAVRRLMLQNARSPGTAAVSEPAIAPTRAHGSKASASLVIDDSGAPGAPRSTRVLRACAAVRLTATLAFAAVLAATYMISSGFSFDLLAAAFLVATYAWPAVLVLSITAAISWRGVAAIVLAYALILAAIIGATVWLTTVDALQMASVWFSTNAQPSALALLFLAPPIRAVGPIAAAFMIVAVAGAIAIVLVTGNDPRAFEAAARIGTALHLGAVTAPALLLATGALLAGAAGWVLLRGLGRLYRARLVTDQSILADAVLAMFAVHYGLGLAYLAPLAALAALAAFVAAKIVTWAGLRAATALMAEKGAAPSLLLLRVFALGKRSERLFSGFGRLWRYHGNIRMIAGPDLATATVEPDQFLDFAAGRLRDNFIDSEGELDERLRATVPRRDFDGRFRTASFFCHDDTWKMALERLAAASDVVLMDLRAFGPVNKACVFEIEELCEGVALSKVLFLIDATTDRAFLADVFGQAWDKITPASPNWVQREARAHVLMLREGGTLHARQVVARLIAAAQATSASAPLAAVTSRQKTAPIAR